MRPTPTTPREASTATVASEEEESVELKANACWGEGEGRVLGLAGRTYVGDGAAYPDRFDTQRRHPRSESREGCCAEQSMRV